MVNPYQTPTDASGNDDGVVDEAAIRFAGGWPAILTVGSLTGVLAMLLPGILDSLSPNFGLLGIIVLVAPFFALSYALLLMVRGVVMTPLRRFLGACLMTPVSIIVFVPVCFGGVVTMSFGSGLWYSLSPDVAEQIGIMIGLGVVLIGFAIIAAVMSKLIRSWVALRRLGSSTVVPTDAAVVDLDGNPPIDPAAETDA